jgi:hypothetical protein
MLYNPDSLYLDLPMHNLLFTTQLLRMLLVLLDITILDSDFEWSINLRVELGARVV